MNVLSLFDGISCGQVALARAGIKVDKYYASEIDKHAISITQKNWPDTIQLGDVTKWRTWPDLSGNAQIDILFAGSPCFVAGTPVLTIDGYKNIEDVNVGDLVLTHTNQWKKVLRVGGNKDSDIFNIKAQGIFNIETTPEHPFYVSKKYKRFKGDSWQLTEPQWMGAKDIERNNYLAIPKYPDSAELPDLNDDELFVLGRYIADGHTRKDFKTKDRKKPSRHYQLILSIGNKKNFETHLHHHLAQHTENVERMVFSNKKLVLFAEDQCGCGAANKFIGPKLLGLPKEKLKIVIRGIMSGDGCERNGFFKISSISKKLIDCLQIALVKCYSIAGCNYKNIRNPTCVIQGRVVNQNHSYALEYRLENTKTFSDNRFVWVPVKKLGNTDYKKDVFNLEVEDDNSYVAGNTVVHNCQGFSLLGKQLNFEDPRSKLFFDAVNILNEVKPKYFLFENVKMKKEYEDVISGHLGVAPIKINSSLVSAQSRGRLYWTNIPNITQPADRGLKLIDIIEEPEKVIVDCDKAACLSATYWKGTTWKSYKTKRMRQALFFDLPGRVTEDWMYEYNGVKEKIQCGKHFRLLSVVETERLQTLPDNYTAGPAKTHRYHSVGNSWTVDVIKHILENIK